MMALWLCLRIALVVISIPALLVLGDNIRRLRYAWAQHRHSCQAAPRVKQSCLLLGFDFLRDFLRSVDEHRVLRHHLQVHRATGHTMSMDLMGDTVIHTADPVNIKTVLSEQQTRFDLGHNRYKAFHPFLGDAIFTSDGAAWSEIRRLIRPNLSREHLVGLLGLIETHMQRTVMTALREARGAPVDMQPLFLSLTMGVSSQFLFGHSMANSDPGADFTRAFELGQEGMAVRARLGPLRDLLVRKDFWTACRTARTYVSRYVQESRQLSRTKSTRDSKQRYTFLEALADKVSSEDALSDHVLSLLVAGRDTTASLLSITFFLLARHPRVWSQLLSEVDLLDGQAPNYETIKQMTYLSYVLIVGE